MAALIVAVVGIPIAVLATRQYGNRRRKLLFDWSATPLIHGGETADLAVTYKGKEVKDPYILSLVVANVGPMDIASDHFDGGRKLRIKLGCTLYGRLDASSTGRFNGALRDMHPMPESSRLEATARYNSDAYIDLHPGLMSRGLWWGADAIVSGRPSPVLENCLIDTDVVDRSTYERPRRIVEWLMYGALGRANH